jgi:hypothetical protein
MSMALLVLMSAAFTASGCGDDGGTATPTTAPASEETSPEPATGVPGREADVRGVVSEVSTDHGVEHLLGDPSNSYYEGMLLRRGEPVVVDGETVSPLNIVDLEDGAEVEVWVASGCDESNPVQCDVVALRVSNST